MALHPRNANKTPLPSILFRNPYNGAAAPQENLMPSPSDLEEFAAFCRQATDSQLLAIHEKEQTARRQAYARLAKEEAARRGLSLP